MKLRAFKKKLVTICKNLSVLPSSSPLYCALTDLYSFLLLFLSIVILILAFLRNQTHVLLNLSIPEDLW